jgi:uncharacterized protein (DUF427 family)
MAIKDTHVNLSRFLEGNSEAPWNWHQAVLVSQPEQAFLQAVAHDGNLEGEDAMSANSGPGFKKHPNHRITTQPAGVRVQVKFNGEVIADTRDAIRLDEATYAAVYYIPRKDVKMEWLSRTSHQTYCPFKGQASYYSLVNGLENAVWTYEQPYDEMLAIKEHLAFYPDKVDSIAAVG